MHILYTSDENYVRHAAAAMMSLMDHNRGVKELTLHFLSMGITAESRVRLEALCAGFGREILFYELGDIRRWFDFPVNSRGFAVSALARLFLARVLPESVERVLYMDCDTLVNDDLTALWQTNLDGCYLGMVAEPTVRKSRRAELSMPDSQPYFNSGVLLINLKLWRQDNAEKIVLDYYCAKGGNLMAPDQDAINGAFVGKIRELSPRYNYGSVQLYYPWKAQKRMSAPTPFLAEEDYLAAVAHPAIIHFLGEERPWRAGNRHPYTPMYDRYLSMTPWKDTPKEEGWRGYFACFALFNTLTRPFPLLRWRIISGLIPAFMKVREKRLKRGRRPPF